MSLVVINHKFFCLPTRINCIIFHFMLHAAVTGTQTHRDLGLSPPFTVTGTAIIICHHHRLARHPIIVGRLCCESSYRSCSSCVTKHLNSDVQFITIDFPPTQGPASHPYESTLFRNSTINCKAANLHCYARYIHYVSPRDL